MSGTGTDRTLVVKPVLCSGHGSCAELLPGLVTLDEWGFPVIGPRPVPAALHRRARRAVTDCPALALMLTQANEQPQRELRARP
jgi:ferredoxin